RCARRDWSGAAASCWRFWLRTVLAVCWGAVTTTSRSATSLDGAVDWARARSAGRSPSLAFSASATLFAAASTAATLGPQPGLRTVAAGGSYAATPGLGETVGCMSRYPTTVSAMRSPVMMIMAGGERLSGLVAGWRGNGAPWPQHRLGPPP